MTESHTAFVGSIPENYDLYLGPLIFEVYAEDLAKRLSVPSGGVVLETAAGIGIATRHLRNRLPSDVHIVATDLNEAMLKIAQTKFGGNERIAFQPANARQLPFDDASFDAVVCQFSLMFFPDKLVAMREVVRILKPGGTFLFNRCGFTARQRWSPALCTCEAFTSARQVSRTSTGISVSMFADRAVGSLSRIRRLGSHRLEGIVPLAGCRRA